MIESTEKEVDRLRSRILDEERLLEQAVESREVQLEDLKGLNWLQTAWKSWKKIEGKKKLIRSLAFDKWKCQKRLEALITQFNIK